MDDLSLDDKNGLGLPSAVGSRNEMLPDIPGARRLLERYGATDLAEVIFGEDA